MCRSILILLLSVVLYGSISAQQPRISKQDDIEDDVALAPCKNADRLAAVEKLFRSHGATDADIQIIEKKNTKNLVITKKGTADGTIIVGAHYDKVSDGCGAIDNWTGIVDIAHLYATIRPLTTKKTFKFIAFDREEEGLIGSGVFVGQIPKDERASVCSMVNLDSFGFAATQVLANASSSRLVDAAKVFWKKEDLNLSAASIANADADSTSFVKAGIPAITFHGLNNDWQRYLHSSNDKLSNINMKSVFWGYRTILPFLLDLDLQSCDAYRGK
jgi:Zn-dependent M28 family amino/carboxypeptidase